MTKAIFLLALILLTLSCKKEPTNTETNEVETIHGFVRTLENSQMAGMLGDTALNEFYVDPSYGASVFPNPVFDSAVVLNLDIAERDVYQINITPARGSDKLKTDLDELSGIDISEYPDYTEKVHIIIFDDVMGVGTSSLQLDTEDFFEGFNFIEIRRYKNGEELVGEPTLIPVFIVK
jgi:hypothetical protein